MTTRTLQKRLTDWTDKTVEVTPPALTPNKEPQMRTKYRSLFRRVTTYLLAHIDEPFQMVKLTKKFHLRGLALLNKRAAVKGYVELLVRHGQVVRVEDDGRKTDHFFRVVDEPGLKRWLAQWTDEPTKKERKRVERAAVKVQQVAESNTDALVSLLTGHTAGSEQRTAVAAGIKQALEAGLTKPYDLAIGAVVALKEAGFRIVKAPQSRRSTDPIKE